MPISLKDLEKLAAKLRSDTGCPWDREQTIASLLKCVEDEVEEVRQAIENGDHDNLKEELGDVLFSMVMIVQIAKEKGYFTMDQVLTDIDKKIRERHTWVFGKDKAKTPEEALKLWRRNKELLKKSKK